VAFAETHRASGFIAHLIDRGNLALRLPAGLARLSVADLADALSRLPRRELEVALRHKLVTLVALPGLRLWAGCGDAALRHARETGREVVAEASLEDFHEAIRRTHGSHLLRDATFALGHRRPGKSARRRTTPPQIVAGLIGLLLAALGLMVLPLHLSWLLGGLLAGLFFLAVIALRMLSLMPPVHRRDRPARPLADAELPVYTVLVPLFRETSVLDQLLAALGHIDYPRRKLDIKLILEESDVAMRRAVAEFDLPAHFETVVVPAGLPQTKPRALNYGLRFAAGELLAIYDAEDIPEPQQLRLAAESFADLPHEVACLQAELAFYNPCENWLARQFTIEYAGHFGLLLPALADHRLPVPLGGTSNHFRIDVLRRVGAWDPHNVTEDADLGFRLARDGYAVAPLASRTYEEANVRLGNWLKQRSRWLKGFLMTWLVHTREPSRVVAEVGPAGFWAAQVLTIGVFASALLHPLCLTATVVLFILEPVPRGLGPIAVGLAGLNLLVLVSGYAVAMVAGRRGLRRLGIAGWTVPLATMPFYWLLLSLAAWMALWQFAVAPFHWNKTEHGLSRYQKRRRRNGAGRRLVTRRAR
jgi:cellulose synthase/poly-beta-1,6-N-acetylglucosamine synthase-like glycosyltransferase